MIRDILKLTGVSAIALSLAAGPVAAQSGFNEWDVNENTAIDDSEFNTGFSEDGAFGEWDEDDDDMLSEDEFNAGVFGGYDEDESGDLDEEEFSRYEDDAGEEGFWDW